MILKRNITAYAAAILFLGCAGEHAAAQSTNQTPNRASYRPFLGTEFDTTSQTRRRAQTPGSGQNQSGTAATSQRTPRTGDQPNGTGDATSAANDLSSNQSDQLTSSQDRDLFPDYRPREDRDVFNEPPAGHDPLLFQIEDIEPLTTDRRPARLARIEPYDPVGIRLGTFVLFPETEILARTTDNIFSEPDGRSDEALELSGTARLVSNWSAHAIELRGSIDSSHYNEFPSEDTKTSSVELRGRLDATRRTNLQGLLRRDYGQESRTGVDANRTSDRADIVTETATLALNHRFNRLSLQLRGSVSDTDYSETQRDTNRDRDNRETEQAIRAAWRFKPTLSAFTEVTLTQTETGAPSSNDGISRSADDRRVRAGLDFGSTGQILRGEISIGYGHQSPDDARLSDTHAFLFDANVAWRPSELTTLLLTGSTQLGTSTNELTSGVVTRSVGLEVRHAFRRYLVASAGITYIDYDYRTSTLDENAISTRLEAEYFASRGLIFTAGYEHTAFDTSVTGQDYTTNAVWAGVRLRK